MLRLLVLLWIIFLAYIPVSVKAASPTLIVLLTPGLKLEDLNTYYHLHQLALNGNTGLVNCNSASGIRSLAGSYLTVGAGQRSSTVNGLIVLQKDEAWNEQSAPILYQRFTGNSPLENAIIIPNFSLVSNYNDNLGNGAKPGSLGQAFREAGIPLLFFGNHDLPGHSSRPGALLAADYQGLIPQGQINPSINRISLLSPTYYSTNYSALLETISAYLQEGNGLIIIDLADLARLDEIKPNLSPTNYYIVRDRILQEMDSFLAQLLEVPLLAQYPLMLITPYPARENVDLGNSLTPVVFYNQHLEPGLLSSASTKRSGLITNLDLAPTILQQFSLPISGAFRGRIIYSIPTNNHLPRLQADLELHTANHLQRPFFLKGYILLEIILIVSVIIMLVLQYVLPAFFSLIILTLSSGPLLFLLLPLTQSVTMLSRICILLLAGLLLLAIVQRCNNPIFRLAFIYLITMGTILADIIRSAPLMMASLLGYDPMGGSRFYGLGNEYMGVLLGSSVMGYTLLLEIGKSYWKGLEKYLRLAFIPLAGLLIYLVAAPQWGTNVGGGLAFFLTFTVLGLLIGEYRITPLAVLSLGSSALAALIFLFYFDSLRPVEVQSHIGITARILRQEGLASLLPVIERKLTMNLKLIQYSIWSRVLLGFLVCSTLLFCRPLGLIKSIFTKYSYLPKGFAAGIAGTLAALIFNDSGIVAAATAMLFITPTLLYLIIVEASPK